MMTTTRASKNVQSTDSNFDEWSPEDQETVRDEQSSAQKHRSTTRAGKGSIGVLPAPKVFMNCEDCGCFYIRVSKTSLSRLIDWRMDERSEKYNRWFRVNATDKQPFICSPLCFSFLVGWTIRDKATIVLLQVRDCAITADLHVFWDARREKESDSSRWSRPNVRLRPLPECKLSLKVTSLPLSLVTCCRWIIEYEFRWSCQSLSNSRFPLWINFWRSSSFIDSDCLSFAGSGTEAHHRWCLQDGRQVQTSQRDHSHRDWDDRPVLPEYESGDGSKGIQNKTYAPKFCDLALGHSSADLLKVWRNRW